MSDTDSTVDELINLTETLGIMGDMPVSTAYADPELMALRVNMTPPGRRSHTVRFVKRKVLDLRAQRIKRSEANAAKVMAEIEKRVEQRRIKQRERWPERAKGYAEAKAAKLKPAIIAKPPGKVRLRPKKKAKATAEAAEA